MKDITPAQRNKSTCVLIWVAAGLPKWHSGKVNQCRKCRKGEFDPWVRKIPWRRKWQPTPVFLPGKSHGQRSLVGCGPWGSQKVGHDWAHEQPTAIDWVACEQQKFIFYSSGGWDAQDQGTGRFGIWWMLTSGFIDVPLLVCSPIVNGQGLSQGLRL